MTHSTASRTPISHRDVLYHDLDAALTGTLYWDPSADREGGVLLIHGGAGLDQHAREQAERYAKLGYTVLACDMFGEGIAGNRERVMSTLLAFRDDPALLARRAQAGIDALTGSAEHRGGVSAVGFCFGGLAALTAARSGADLVAAISIHGSLATPKPAEPGVVTAQILACHGALDPHVPMTDVVAFTEEMTKAGADWQLLVLGGAQHGFTHRDAAPPGSPGSAPGVAYHQVSDERSFAAASALLAKCFAS